MKFLLKSAVVLSLMAGVVLSLLCFLTVYTTMPEVDNRFAQSEYHIVVKKGISQLALYHAGKRELQFPIATGSNAGSKEVEGDKKTPEGKFTIREKRPSEKFGYVLALDYPLPADADRAWQLRRISQQERNRIVAAHQYGELPPWNTALGGAILIHAGPVPFNNQYLFRFLGTLGCVRVREEDMNILYHRVPVGTPVIIEQ